MAYHERAGSAPLTPWLECFWQRTGTGKAVRVLPDGCMDVVWIEGAGSWIVGPNTTAFLSPVAAGARAIGARLRPGAAAALLDVRAEQLVDARRPLTDLWDGAGAVLADQLEAAADPLAILERALVARVRRASTPDPVVAAATAALQRGDLSLADLAGELGLSDRQLRRRVRAEVGYGPKRLERVLRLRRALTRAVDGDDLARVAAEAGYADQAHFSSECRSLAGVPPTRLLEAA